MGNPALDALLWIDAQDDGYPLVVGGGLAAIFALGVLGIVPTLRRKIDGPAGTALLLALIALTMIVGRSYLCVVNDQVIWDTDEAALLAFARSGFSFPLPWIGFDPQTSGPLDTYALMLLPLVGIKLTFASMHYTALALEYGAIVCLFFAMRRLFDGVTATLAILPPLAFFSLTQSAQAIHYTLEHVDLFLSMLAVALFVEYAIAGRGIPWLIASGIVAGAVPYGKAQAVSYTLWACSATLIGLMAAHAPASTKGKAAFAFLASVPVVGIVLLAVVTAGGGVYDFWMSEVVSSIEYIGGGSPAGIGYILGEPDFNVYILTLAPIGLCGIVLAMIPQLPLTARQRGTPFVFALLVVGAVQSAYAPHIPTGHYLLYLVFPLAASAGTTIGMVRQAVHQSLRAARVPVRYAAAFGVVTFAAGVTLWPLPTLLHPGRPPAGTLAYVLKQPPGDPDVVAMIERYVPREGRMAIWGWQPKYWALTQTIMGTRDCNSHLIFGNHSAYYHERYREDFLNRAPAALLEAADPSGKIAQGYDVASFPALYALLIADYRAVGTIRGNRLWVRRDITPQQARESRDTAQS